MSWSPHAAILHLVKGGYHYNSSTTSTSTILVKPSAKGEVRLRIFWSPARADNIDTDKQENAESEVLSAGVYPARGRRDYISYLDSGPHGNFSFNASAGNLPSTYIASLRDMDHWYFVQNSSPGHPTHRPIRLVGGPVNYVDPSVVPVPEAYGGGYLMLLNRKRQFLHGVSTNPTDLSTPDRSKVVGDIVAYWSDSPVFRPISWGGFSFGRVKGPILLVDSTRALPGADFRVFTGVPSGFFHVEDDGLLSLYLYYAVEFPNPVYIADEAGAYKKAVKASPYAQLYQDEKGFITCKKIPWRNILHALAAKKPEPTWLPTDDVDGDLLGRVRIWIPQPFKKTHRGATEFLVAYDSTVRRHTDPEPEPNEAEATGGANSNKRVLGRALLPPPRPAGVSLFFRAVNELGSPLSWISGHGIWRASSIPDGETLYGLDADDKAASLRSTVFGLDFVVAPNGASTMSRDMVSPAETVTGPRGTVLGSDNPTDPDPVFVPEASLFGEWWVHSGGYYGPHGAHPLGRVLGDASDGRHNWQLAWSF